MPALPHLVVAVLVIWSSTVASAAAGNRQRVTCQDGASCDQDGVGNGTCRVSVCYAPDAGVFHAPCPEPDGTTLDLVQDVVVPLRHHGRRHGRGVRRLGAGTNRTTLVVRCVPSPATLLPPATSKVVAFTPSGARFMTLLIRGCATTNAAGESVEGTLVCAPSDRCPATRGRMTFTITPRAYVIGQADFVNGASCFVFDYHAASGASFVCEDPVGHPGPSGSFRLTLGQHPRC
jgi:hypothetical protein